MSYYGERRQLVEEWELIEFFEVTPEEVNDSRIFSISKGGLRLRVDICQLESYVAILIESEKTNTAIFELTLPRYGWICFEKSKNQESVDFGPPRDLHSYYASNSYVSCEVQLVIRPSIQVNFNRDTSTEKLKNELQKAHLLFTERSKLEEDKSEKE